MRESKMGKITICEYNRGSCEVIGTDGKNHRVYENYPEMVFENGDEAFNYLVRTRGMTEEQFESDECGMFFCYED